ncbi:hypothetical protein PsYK624_169940 [Phanerochaete sordida]|uniref:Uncharacterized protein n=1 Tax=Phanerochaete sordida TaxID=48140 RepID=A0A9P3GYI2_9APHY|nr:hypothetical protein PsYK624_169940 [Phanerochaete sordida]
MAPEGRSRSAGGWLLCTPSTIHTSLTLCRPRRGTWKGRLPASLLHAARPARRPRRLHERVAQAFDSGEALEHHYALPLWSGAVAWSTEQQYMHMLTISIGQEDMKTCLVSDQRNDASIASHEGAHVLRRIQLASSTSFRLLLIPNKARLTAEVRPIRIPDSVFAARYACGIRDESDLQTDDIRRHR